MLKKKYFLITAFAIQCVAGCSDDNNISNEKNGPKPAMDIVVSPQSGLHYGDNINVSGLMTDEINLEQYVLTLLDSKGDTLVIKQQNLLGQSFNIDDNIRIPLPKNASLDNLTLKVKLDNMRKGELVQAFDLPAVDVPTFPVLYLILSNGQILDLIKNGDVYVTPTENVFPANVKAIVSTTTSKNGVYWGMENGEIACMAKDSIVIGNDVEASFTVSFNPVTFEFSTGEKHIWAPLAESDCYYILGSISGHWQDGEITDKRKKMAMKGFESGNKRYYTWTAPDGDDPEVGMWGSTAAGVFRLIRGDAGEYILWDGKMIVQSNTDDKNKSFPITAGGPFTIKINFEDDLCKSIEVTGGGKSISFSNNRVVVNGSVAGEAIEFCGKNLALKSGTDYIYEGTVALREKQAITAALDLSGFTANPDLFNGGGNRSWTLKAMSDNYLIRMDVFSGAFYACPTSAYPNVLYMDGWSWAPTSTSNAVTWNTANVLPLVRTSKGTYEATFYNFGWGGDVAFYVTYPSSGTPIRLPKTNVNSAYINTSGGDGSFLIPSSAGMYKVITDLKEGINIGPGGTVTPKGSSQFTLDYVPQ